MYGRPRARPPRSARHAPPVFARWALFGALLLSISAGAYAGRALLADLYGDYAQVRQRQLVASRVALDGARLATRLAPWRAELHARYALSTAAREGLEAARPEIARSLALAPGDPFAWRRYAVLLELGGEFGAPLLRALQRTRELAPSARGLERAAALDGVHYWRHGSPELRDFWRARMRQSLRHNSRRFLSAVVKSGRERYLCGYLGAELKLLRWCRNAEYFRGLCNSGLTDPQQLAWCRLHGGMREEVEP